MFLAATDTCAHCKDTIYPSDEKVTHKHDIYHVECSEELNLDDEE